MFWHVIVQPEEIKPEAKVPGTTPVTPATPALATPLPVSPSPKSPKVCSIPENLVQQRV